MCSIVGRLLECLGPLLDASWILLSVSEVASGLWKPFAGLLVRVGKVLAAYWGVLGASWGVRGAHEGLLGVTCSANRDVAWITGAYWKLWSALKCFGKLCGCQDGKRMRWNVHIVYATVMSTRKHRTQHEGLGETRKNCFSSA